MLAASGPFGTLVAGVDHYAAWRVQITLPAAAVAYDDVTLAVERVEIDASTTTDLPEGSRFQVGYPAMECTFTLSGLVDQRDASKTAAWLFGRYSTTSPLYHADAIYSVVTVDLGLYTGTSGGTPELIRKFTGVIDSYVVNDDGAVEFTCIDAMRAKLRSVPASPVVVTAPPYNAGLTSEFAIDALLRAATAGTVSSWPAPRANRVLGVGFRSSVWAEVGTLSTATAGAGSTFTFGPGAFGSALAPATGSIYQAVYAPSVSVQPSQNVFVEFWARHSSRAQVTVSDLAGGFVDVAFIVGLDATGAVYLTVNSTAGGADTYTKAFTLDTDPHYIGVAFSQAAGSAAWSATIFYDGTSTATGSRTTGTIRSTTAVANNVTVGMTPFTSGGTLEALQVTTETSPATHYPFTPQAVLDPSLNSLTVVPGLDAGDPYQVIQQIADAESGVAGGYEDGIFRFYNRNTLRGITSQRDITSASSLTAIGGQETSAAGVVNHATVEFTPWTFAAARSTVWSATSAIKVGANSTRMLTVTTENLYANADTGFSVLPNGSGAVTTSRYRASTSAAGTVEHPGVTVTTAQTSGQTAVLTMVNNTNQDAWFVSPANYVDIPVGTPLLRLAALVVTQGDSAVREFVYPPDTTTTRFGDQAAEISGDLWIQDDATALQLATDIVVDQCVPRPNLTGLALVPDPRIQLTDVVHPMDPDRTGVDEYVRVFGYSIVWEAPSDPQSQMTYDMTIDGRTLAAPGGWIMGVAGRSEIGSTAYVYNGA